MGNDVVFHCKSNRSILALYNLQIFQWTVKVEMAEVLEK